MRKSVKNTVILALIVILAILIIYLFFVGTKALKGPESIAFDQTGKRFLVSNVKGKSIVFMSLEGKYSKFLDNGLSAPRGIIALGGKLYVADETKLQIVDIPTAKITDSIPIAGSKMLNDVALDKTGLVYLTDTMANCVFIVNPMAKTIEKVQSPLLKAPNGIVYDMPRNQMFIVGLTKRSPILSLNTLERSITIFMDSIYSDLDGIAIDDLGRIYISSWAQSMIFMIPQEQNRFIAQFKDLKGAADFFYYLPNNELIVPLLTQNKVIRIPLE